MLDATFGRVIFYLKKINIIVKPRYSYINSECDIDDICGGLII